MTFKLRAMAIALMFCFVPLIMLLIDAAFKRPKKLRKTATDKNFVVRMPEYVLYVGIADCLAVMFLFLVYYIDDVPNNKVAAYMLFIPVLGFWLGTALIIRPVTRKIVVSNDKITVYSPLKKVYSFNMSDIASVKLRGKKFHYCYAEKITIVTKQGKKISAENLEMQYERLCRLIKTNVPNELLTGFD